MIEVLQSRAITALPNTVYTPASLQPEPSKHDPGKQPTATHGAPDPSGSEQSTTDDGQPDHGAGEQLSSEPDTSESEKQKSYGRS